MDKTNDQMVIEAVVKGVKKGMKSVVYDVLMSQTFVDWYEGDFANYLHGDEGCKEQEEIIEQIAQLFHLS